MADARGEKIVTSVPRSLWNFSCGWTLAQLIVGDVDGTGRNRDRWIFQRGNLRVAKDL
jgi:hypothetical protein